jgi:hypothetical protein
MAIRIARATSIATNYQGYNIGYTRDSEVQVMPYGLGWTGGHNQIPLDDLHHAVA